MMYSKLKLYGKIAGLSSIKPRIPFLSQKHGMSDKYLFSILTPYGKIKPTINAIYRGDRMKKINGILCLLLSMVLLSACSFFEKDVLHLGVNAVITEINTENQTITVKDADQNEVIGENCVIACSDIPLFYCHYDTHEIKDISLEDLQVDDSVILGIYNSELEAYKNKTGDNILHIEQLQLGTQRLG